MDPIKDRSQRPLALFQKQGGVVPSYAEKSFSADSYADLTKFSSLAFADPSTRSYPCHDKGAIFASVVHALYHDASDKVLDRLFKSAAAHGICADIDGILGVMIGATKAASAPPPPAEIYALPEKRAYLINNPARYFEVGRQLEKDYGHIPMLDFADACKALTKAASAHNCVNRLSERITSYGQDFVPDFSIAKVELLKRAAISKAPYSDIYRDTASAIVTADSSDARDFVDLIHKTDKAAGLTVGRLKGERIYDAFKTVFGELTVDRVDKAASQSFLIDGKVIPLVAVKAIPAEIALKSFRRNVTDVLEKVAACHTVDDELRREVDGLHPAVRQQIVNLAVTYGPDFTL